MTRPVHIAALDTGTDLMLTHLAERQERLEALLDSHIETLDDVERAFSERDEALEDVVAHLETIRDLGRRRDLEAARARRRR